MTWHTTGICKSGVCAFHVSQISMLKETLKRFWLKSSKHAGLL